MNNKIWTIKEILQWTTNYFEEKEIDSPRLTAELLLSKSLKQTRLYLYTNFSKPLLKKELNKFKELIKRRIKGEPVAYILGRKEFWSLDFEVNSNVLIPRPETEILVETVNNFIVSDTEYKILEIGTGCGNIPVAIAYENKNTSIISIDISFEALKVAKQNILKHKVYEQVCLVKSDILSCIKYSPKFDIVVSNPPYIKKDDLDRLQIEIKKYEPLNALDGGDDGLIFYRKIIEDAKYILKDGGVIFFEFGEEKQGENIKKIMLDFNYKNIVIVNDYAGLPRVIYGQK